jgi:hypothetical protein
MVTAFENRISTFYMRCFMGGNFLLFLSYLLSKFMFTPCKWLSKYTGSREPLAIVFDAFLTLHGGYRQLVLGILGGGVCKIFSQISRSLQFEKPYMAPKGFT